MNPFNNHNHKRCITSALKTAEQICAQRNLRFTDIRRDVLEVIWSSHQPVSAYDILRELRQHKPNAEPPTVYRALDFLLDNHLAHRIESLNAFIGCDHAGDNHTCQFLICSKCQNTVELSHDSGINSAIYQKAKNYNFQIDKPVIEIQGICKQCQ